MEGAFYIYIVFRLDGSPCYVGKGSGIRWRRHARKSHNTHLARIISKSGGELPVVRIRHGLTSVKAFEVERALILAIGRLDQGAGPLVNQTDGGEGGPGHIVTNKTKEAIRAALLNKPKSEEHRAAMRGPRGPMQPEHIAAISARQTGKKHHPEWNAAIGRGNRNSPKNPARCKAIGDAQRGIPKGPCTEARREAARLGMMAYHANRRAAAGEN